MWSSKKLLRVVIKLPTLNAPLLIESASHSYYPTLMQRGFITTSSINHSVNPITYKRFADNYFQLTYE